MKEATNTLGKGTEAKRKEEKVPIKHVVVEQNNDVNPDKIENVSKVAQTATVSFN